MGSSISAINDDYAVYEAVCQHLGLRALPLYNHPNDESFYDHESRLRKDYGCDTTRQLLRLPERTKPATTISAEQRVIELENAMRQLRADATKGMPMCVNLAHIDRRWAAVGVFTV